MFITHSAPSHDKWCEVHFRETTAVSTSFKQISAAAAAIAVAMFAFGAQAQEAKTTPKAKVAACNSLKEETACTARSDCGWTKESKDEKTGKVKKKAYCHAKPAAKKK
jgi:hypothetical protein